MDWTRYVEKECHTCHRKFMSPVSSTTQLCYNCGGLPAVNSGYDMDEGHY